MKALNPVEQRIVGLIEPAAEALGFRLVRVRLSGLRRKTLQIMAERADGTMSGEDTRKLARALQEPLEEIEFETLEVSSPGIDRPLVRLDDFARFAGHDAKLETTLMVDGRKRFKGVIKGVEGEDVLLTLPEGEARFPFASLAEARLVLTDRLIEEDLKRAKAAEAVDAEEAERTRKTQ